MVQGLGKRIFQAELQAINCCNCNCLFASYWSLQMIKDMSREILQWIYNTCD
jgi:hypothetical protein